MEPTGRATGTTQLQDTEAICKNPLYFVILAMNNGKVEVKNNTFDKSIPQNEIFRDKSDKFYE